MYVKTLFRVFLYKAFNWKDEKIKIISKTYPVTFSRNIAVSFHVFVFHLIIEYIPLLLKCK